MSNGRLSFSGLTFLILLLCFTESCKAQNKSVCIPSFCGNINISYPFRLGGDPVNCGHPDPIFALECQNNQTLLHSRSRRYHVQAITCSNFSMRLSDPVLDSNNYSSCPIYSGMDNDISSSYMYSISTTSIYMTFLNCLSPVTNPLYIENPFCGNTSAFSNSTRIYSYVTVGSILVSDLDESCTYDTMAEASSPWSSRDHNYSYSQIHDLLAYGFELSWYRAMRTECDKSKGTCTVEDNKIRCRHYCYEDTPLSERTFGCKLEYYAPYLFIAALAIGALIALRFVIGIPCLIGLVVYKRKRLSSSLNDSEIIEELLRHQVNLMPINYPYGEIKKMTSNFKAKLGEGPRGTVYRGNLRSGPPAAVKILINSSASNKEFIGHIATISKISHPNIVKLIGFCIEGTKRALLHEFMQCGSVEKHISSHEGMKQSLSYGEMFKISLGVAHGIECLHSNQTFHLGIKPQNILLDEDFSPKISDSGLAKLYSSDYHRVESAITAKGKTGFIPPELFHKNIGEISCKADVYSYGMLVLEILARLQSLNPYENKPGHVYFPSWIYNQMSEVKDLEMRDAEEEEREMVKKMIVVALWCIQIRPGDRPSMNEVVAMLQGEIELLHMPRMPFQRAMDDEEFVEKSS